MNKTELQSYRERAARWLSARLKGRASVTLTRREVQMLMMLLAPRRNRGAPTSAPARMIAMERGWAIAAHYLGHRPAPVPRGWRARTVATFAELYEVDPKTVERAIKRFVPKLEALAKQDTNSP